MRPVLMTFIQFNCRCFRFSSQPEFIVGYGDKDYENYRKLTARDFLNRATRDRLLRLHDQSGGFPLAEPTLVIKERLCVADGWVNIDGWCVTVVRKVPGEDLTVCGVYAAMTRNTKFVWSTTPPPVDGTWGVDIADIYNWPCLFVRSVRRTSSLRCSFDAFSIPSAVPLAYFIIYNWLQNSK